MKPVLVLGAREISTEIADLAVDAGFEVAGYVENEDRERRGPFNGRPLFWIDDIADMSNTHDVVGGLSTTTRRRFTEQVQAMGFDFATVIHPTAHISSLSTVGVGSVIGPGVIVGSNTMIENNVYVSRGALIGHHTLVRDHSTLLPGVNLAGSCRVGPSAWIGMGAVIIDGLIVGSHCMVAAGATVVRDVEDNVMVMGVPARVVKRAIKGR